MTGKEEKRDEFDWFVHMERSREKYRTALETGDLESLKHHNIVTDVDKEVRFMQLLCPSLRAPAGLKALDVCCGAGAMANGLRQAGFEVTGLDLDENAIAFAIRRFPGVRFLMGDATRPQEAGVEGPFNLVVMREVHPLTRIGDFEFAWNFVQQYLTLLTPARGALVIAHAPPPDAPSVDMTRLKAACAARGYAVAGPYYYSLYKRAGGDLQSGAVVAFFSWVSAILNLFLRRRWIRYFVVSASPKGV